MRRGGGRCTSSPVAMAARPTPRHAPCCTTSLVPLFFNASVRYEIAVLSPAPPKGREEGREGGGGKEGMKKKRSGEGVNQEGVKNRIKEMTKIVTNFLNPRSSL